MRARRKTGSYQVGRERREAILDAATGHFAQSGYHSTSMAQIARDVELSEAGLLHHFPTKRHLLVAVAKRRFDIAAEWAADVPATADGLQPLRVLLRITELFLTQPGLIELFVLVSSEAADAKSPAHSLYVEHYDHVIRAIAEGFQEGVDSGLLRADIDCTAIAQQCIAMSDGLQLQWVLSKGALDLVARIREYLEQLAPHVTVSGENVDLGSEPAYSIPR